MTDTLSANWSLKEEIRTYWGLRAATFDDAFGHRIPPGPEFDAWSRVLEAHLGPAPLRVLELASGTGEVSRVLLSLGHDLTGIDFAEPMLERCRAKHRGDPRAVFRLGDAENTMEPDGAYDAVVCRHLVWTLTDPVAALRDWHRVLRPGGRLVIFDGDFVNLPWRGRLARRAIETLAKVSGTGAGRHRDPSLDAQHARILSGLPFNKGLRFPTLALLVEEAGFAAVRRESYAPVLAALRRIAPGAQEWLRTFLHDRFVLVARKPD
ncbi:class I SAM-dependent methyltransferase [uncultured Alsobacter sp.]|uniref:class I SAM-dependent methyltransferase n=1 Tax=uncultured Alsobacter sp. TaxID=1748258 RepID=UPI0025CD95A3|nr:class I SAM-dependent methyltransferase [uncultured Alsobacter sp.]